VCVNATPSRYFIVGARPVRLVPTADGGLDVQVIDWASGTFVRDMSYLSRVYLGDGEVDEVPAADFERAVAAIRAKLASGE
jgi:hypothetical protein